MRSETYMSKINLQRGKLTVEKGRVERKNDMLRKVSVNSPGNPWSQSRRRNGRLWWEGFAEKGSLSLEWKSEGMMDDESGDSIELMEEMPLKEMGEAELERLVRG